VSVNISIPQSSFVRGSIILLREETNNHDWFGNTGRILRAFKSPLDGATRSDEGLLFS
jgi:hypothetical protein